MYSCTTKEPYYVSTRLVRVLSAAAAGPGNPHDHTVDRYSCTVVVLLELHTLINAGHCLPRAPLAAYRTRDAELRHARVGGDRSWRVL
jgi:hypothetical protein